MLINNNKDTPIEWKEVPMPLLILLPTVWLTFFSYKIPWLPWLLPIFQISLTNFKIPWLFPDLEKNSFSPDFSLTVGTLNRPTWTFKDVFTTDIRQAYWRPCYLHWVQGRGLGGGNRCTCHVVRGPLSAVPGLTSPPSGSHDWLSPLMRKSTDYHITYFGC